MTRIATNTTEMREEFKRLREAKGLSQSRVAELLGVSQNAVSTFENGTAVRPRGGLVKYLEIMDTWRHVSTLGGEPVIKTVECDNCGREVPGSFNGLKLIYCGMCGDVMGKECPSCNTVNDGDAKFCKTCGTLIDEAIQDATFEYEEVIRKVNEPRAVRVKAAEKRARRRKEPRM